MGGSHLSAQLDNCKVASEFLIKKSININNVVFSTSEKNVKGLIAFELNKVGDLNSGIKKSFQDTSWTNKGVLGALSFDHFGNVYVVPSPNVNTLENPPHLQNTVLRVDARTGQLAPFISLPMERLPNQQNPFGLIASFFDCSNKHLIVSSLAGSTRKEEFGKVYVIDILKKSFKIILENTDAFGLAIHEFGATRKLYFGSPRNGNLYSLELDKQNNPIGKPVIELSLDGYGRRGDDRIKKIRFSADGKMTLTTAMFYYNLTAPSEAQQGKVVLQLVPTTGKWQIINYE